MSRILAHPRIPVSRLLFLFAVALGAPAIAQDAIPEPAAGDLVPLVIQALAGRQYVLLGAVALLVVVWVLRKVGARVLPWLGTPRGGALLSVVGGTLAVLVSALAAGQPLTPGLVLSAVSAALTAAGLWSTSKNLAKPAPRMAPEQCTPADRARGLC